MNTCKDCKWWDEYGSEECGHPSINEQTRNDGLIVECDFSYVLLVGPDFGCIHWEKKE